MVTVGLQMAEITWREWIIHNWKILTLSQKPDVEIQILLALRSIEGAEILPEHVPIEDRLEKKKLSP